MLDLKGYVYDKHGYHDGYVYLSSNDIKGVADFLTKNKAPKMVTDLGDLPFCSTINVHGMGDILDYVYDPYKVYLHDLRKYCMEFQFSGRPEVSISASEIDIIMSYTDFQIGKRDGKLYAFEKDKEPILVKEIARISFQKYNSMTSSELILEYDADYTGELDDCSAYAFYKKI